MGCLLSRRMSQVCSHHFLDSSKLVLIARSDYNIEVTTKTTMTVMTTICCSATPQPQSPSLSGSHKHLASPPTSPLRGKIHRPHSERSTSELSSTSTTCTPISDPAYTSPLSPSKQPGVSVFSPLQFSIPHPDQIQPLPYTHPPPKKWYAVTVGQDVSVFDDWYGLLVRTSTPSNHSSRLLIQELIDGVMGACQKGYKTFEQALAHYSDKYFGSTVFHLPFPGSRWFQPIEDWIPQ